MPVAGLIAHMRLLLRPVHRGEKTRTKRSDYPSLVALRQPIRGVDHRAFSVVTDKFFSRTINVLLETLSPDCVLASICPWAKKVMPEVDVRVDPAEFVAESGADEKLYWCQSCESSVAKVLIKIIEGNHVIKLGSGVEVINASCWCLLPEGVPVAAKSIVVDST